MTCTRFNIKSSLIAFAEFEPLITVPRCILAIFMPDSSASICIISNPRDELCFVAIADFWVEGGVVVLSEELLVSSTFISFLLRDFGCTDALSSNNFRIG